MHTLIVDDHEQIRLGTKVLLNSRYPDMTFSEASCIEQTLGFASGPPVDLILLDLYMPGSRNLDALTAVIEAFQKVPVVVVSAETDGNIIDQTYECGACAFVQKAEARLLMAAVETALVGGTFEYDYSGKRKRHTLVEPIAAPAAATFDFLPEGLSERHGAVMECVHAGKGNKAIARDLHLSVSTVKNYLSKVFEVFGADNRTAALAVYLRLKEAHLQKRS